MVTHFDPYLDGEAEQVPCGTFPGEASEFTGNWAHVDCRLCLKHKAKIMAAHAAEELAIVQQMGDMAKHMPGYEQEDQQCQAQHQE